MQEPGLPDEPLNAEPLVKPGGPDGELDRLRASHNLLQDEALQPVLWAARLRHGAGQDDLFADQYTRRADRLAGTTVEAVVHVLGHGFRQLELALIYPPHQLHTAARRLDLDRVCRVRRAHRKTESALHARHQIVVVGRVRSGELGSATVNGRRWDAGRGHATDYRERRNRAWAALYFRADTMEGY